MKKEKLKLAKMNYWHHKKQMEYYEKEIEILKGKI